MNESDPGAPPLGDQVHVWHGVVGPEPGCQRDLAVLSAGERERAARFVRPRDRARYAASHAAVRRLLGRYLGADPASIRFGRARCCRCGSTEHGRPVVEWPVTALNHSLSHSGEHWLLAIADGRPVGADLECHRGLEMARMSDACLTEAERSYLESQPPGEQLATFFRCWTRKEAVLKACGVGLAGKLSGVEVWPRRSTAVQVRHSSGTCPGTWLVHDLPCGEDWSAAVAQPASQAGPVISVCSHDSAAGPEPGARPAPGGPT